MSVAPCFGQKSKTIYIVNGKDNNLYARILFNDSDTPTDTIYILQGRDATYMRIINVITVKSGDYLEMRSLLDKAIDIWNDDVGTSYHLVDNTISLVSMMGIKVVYINSDNGNGVMSFRHDQLERMRKRLDKFAVKQL